MVRRKQVANPGPAEILHNWMFVPQYVCSDVLQWGHSKLTCHPSLVQTLRFPQQWFWWPSMQHNTRSFVVACPMCARSKSSKSPPAIFLNPLLILCPWDCCQDFGCLFCNFTPFPSGVWLSCFPCLTAVSPVANHPDYKSFEAVKASRLVSDHFIPAVSLHIPSIEKYPSELSSPHDLPWHILVSPALCK